MSYPACDESRCSDLRVSSAIEKYAKVLVLDAKLLVLDAKLLVFNNCTGGRGWHACVAQCTLDGLL